MAITRAQQLAAKRVVTDAKREAAKAQASAPARNGEEAGPKLRGKLPPIGTVEGPKGSFS